MHTDLLAQLPVVLSAVHQGQWVSVSCSSSSTHGIPSIVGGIHPGRPPKDQYREIVISFQLIPLTHTSLQP